MGRHLVIQACRTPYCRIRMASFFVLQHHHSRRASRPELCPARPSWGANGIHCERKARANQRHRRAVELPGLPGAGMAGNTNNYRCKNIDMYLCMPHAPRKGGVLLGPLPPIYSGQAGRRTDGLTESHPVKPEGRPAGISIQLSRNTLAGQDTRRSSAGVSVTTKPQNGKRKEQID